MISSFSVPDISDCLRGTSDFVGTPNDFASMSRREPHTDWRRRQTGPNTDWSWSPPPAPLATTAHGIAPASCNTEMSCAIADRFWPTTARRAWWRTRGHTWWSGPRLGDRKRWPRRTRAREWTGRSQAWRNLHSARVLRPPRHRSNFVRAQLAREQVTCHECRSR
jgi:hypothetical protein